MWSDELEGRKGGRKRGGDDDDDDGYDNDGDVGVEDAGEERGKKVISCTVVAASLVHTVHFKPVSLFTPTITKLWTIRTHGTSHKFRP